MGFNQVFFQWLLGFIFSLLFRRLKPLFVHLLNSRVSVTSDKCYAYLLFSPAAGRWNRINKAINLRRMPHKAGQELVKKMTEQVENA